MKRRDFFNRIAQGMAILPVAGAVIAVATKEKTPVQKAADWIDMELARRPVPHQYKNRDNYDLYDGNGMWDGKLEPFEESMSQAHTTDREVT